MAKDELKPRPEEIKMPITELEIMANFSTSTEFHLLKRWARRYADSLKTRAFMLDETDPKFPIKHRSYTEQVMGMNILLKLVSDAGTQLNKLEGDEE